MDINEQIARIYAEGDLLLGSILSLLPKRQSTITKTAAIVLDKENKSLSLVWNDEFFSELTLREIRATLRHEAMHVAFSHLFRMKNKNTHQWNVATDMFINQNVQDLPEGGVTLPEGWCPQLSSDEYYDLLSENPDIMDEYPKTENHSGWEEVADNEQASEEINNKVKDLAERAREAGDQMGRKALSAIPTKPSRAWASAIRKMFQPTEREVTYKTNRFDRRRTYGNGEDMIPARADVPHCPKVYVAIDTSGSIGEEMLSRFASEVNDMSRYADVECLVFDHEIQDRFKWRVCSSVELKGGGGTCFQDVFDVACSDRDSSGIIILTDGYAERPTLQSKVKTLWVLTKDHNPEVRGWFGRSEILEF